MRIEEVRSGLAGRLRARRAEIERMTLTQVYAVSPPDEASDPEYAHSLRAAVSAAIGYSLEGMRRSDERGPAIPPALLAQARLAARGEVSLDTVLRRYFAGYTLLGDFLVGEAEAEGIGGADLKRLLRDQAARFDRVLATVADEYTSALPSAQPGSAEERRAAKVQRLLDGELVDVTELAYDFDASHIGVIATGPAAAEAIGDLATALDSRHLLIPSGGGVLWAWLGSRRGLDPERLTKFLSDSWPDRVSLVIGEPAEGLPGWRLSHRQAKAALQIARRTDKRITHYADVALLAAVLQDELLTASLQDLYLTPLAAERDGGEVARQTLRAYFAAERNVSSAAAALGVNRHTVTNRLRTIENRIGRTLDRCAVDLEVALKLENPDPPRAASTQTPVLHQLHTGT